ncbi:uncharacterized [Tachysurus ichikawai]
MQAAQQGEVTSCTAARSRLEDKQMPQPEVEWRFLFLSVGKDESVQDESQSNKEYPRLESPSPKVCTSTILPLVSMLFRRHSHIALETAREEA